MANPYLIQALYGPKPTAPATSARDRDGDNDRPAPQSRTLSLAEQLYGKESGPETKEIERAYSDSHYKDDTNEVTENPDQVAHPWAPTGSNVLPVGSKLTDSNGSVSLPSLTNPPVASVTVAASSARLKIAPNRYLPPPGPYYDQFSLAQVLDIKFTSDKCWTCWNDRSGCTKQGPCTKMCKVCGTSNHPGKTCPSLYCTISWFNDRNVSPFNNVREADRQFRPSQTELGLLLQQGLVLDSGDRTLPIMPNMAHPTVKNFYRNKPAPQAIQVEAKSNSARMGMNTGRGALMRNDNLRVSLAQTNDRAFVHTPLRNPSNLVRASAANHELKLHGTGAPRNDTTKQTEDRLQELEDEVLRLTTDNMLKDREIRRLKKEVVKLSGDGYGSGRKRPCL